MTRSRRLLRVAGVFCLLVATTVGVMAQESGKVRKFLRKPLVIEDQGSFFIGGIPKVTPYATMPPPNAPDQPPQPNQITIGQMYVQFQIPANRKANTPPVIMVHGSTHTAACLESTRTDAKDGGRTSFATGFPPTSSIRPGADARGSTSRSSTKPPR